MSVTALRPHTLEDRRLLDRDDAICDAVRTALGNSGLSPDIEADMWVITRNHIEAILHLADHAMVTRLEVEALDRRLTTHAETCASCRSGQHCQRFRVLTIRRGRLQASSDRGFRALLEGKRR